MFPAWIVTNVNFIIVFFLIAFTSWHFITWFDRSLLSITLNPKQPKVFGVKFSLSEIRRIFFIKMRNYKLRKVPKLLNFSFPEGWYFLNCYNTELKRSSKIIFPVAERHRLAMLGERYIFFLVGLLEKRGKLSFSFLFRICKEIRKLCALLVILLLKWSIYYFE